MQTITEPKITSPNSKSWLFGILIIQLFATLNVNAFTEVAGGGLFLNTTLSYNSDSNFFGSVDNAATSETSISLRPTIEWSRNKGTGSISATLGTNITRYQTLNQYNDENYNFSFNLDFPIEGSQVSGGIKINYAGTQDVDEYLQIRVERSSFNASLNGNYRLRNKLYFNATLRTNSTSTTGYSNTSNQVGSLGVVLSDLWNGTSLNLSYRYQILETSGDSGTAVDTGKGSFSASLSGQLLPDHIFSNLTAQASVHVNHTETQSRLGYNVNIKWEPRPRTSFTLAMNSDLDLTADDNSVTKTNFTFSVQQSIAQKWDVSASIGKAYYDYETEIREDRSSIAGIRVNYKITRNWNAGASFNYNKTNSVSGGKDFERGTYSLSASYRF